MLLAGILTGGILGSVFAENHARRVCTQCDAVIHELENYRVDNGVFPTNVANLASIEDLTKLHRIYLGQATSDGEVQWQPHEVGRTDVSLFISPTGYICIVPIERTSLISFSSFSVYARANGDARWQKRKVHWSLLGAYLD